MPGSGSRPTGRNGRAGAQTGNHGFERIDGEGIRVLARGEAIA